jgi:peptidoglycan/xylan/chitin deacetylase (PgdA/CDA1 family)
MSGLRRAIRDAAASGLAQLLHATGATRPGRRTDVLTIVTLHRVLPVERRAECPLPHLALPEPLFDALLGALRDVFDVRPVSEALDAFRGEQTPARPLLALTFDDGARDNLEVAAPRLARHGVRATFYVVADAARDGALLWHDRLAWAAAAAARRGGALFRGLDVGAPRFVRELLALAKRSTRAQRLELEAELTRTAGLAAPLAPGDGVVPEWEGTLRFEELRALVAAGHEVGSHSRSHELLRRDLAPDLEGEVAGSRAALEAGCGVRVRSFCYPNGDHDDAAVAAVRAAGYDSAVTTEVGANGRALDPLRLRRVELVAESIAARDGSLSPARLAWRLRRARGA